MKTISWKRRSPPSTASAFAKLALALVTAGGWAITPESRAAYAWWVYPAQDGRMLYRRDALGNRLPDFAGAGYHGGAVPLPNIPVRVAVRPVPGDNTENIQTAINRIAALLPDENGFRGAVLLVAGEYPISGSLWIGSSGIVLRGEGDSENGTVLRATGNEPNQRELIIVTGNSSPTNGPEIQITDSYVPVGMRSFNVAATNGLFPGANVRVHRPSPQNWIEDIGMYELDWVIEGNGGVRYYHGTNDTSYSWQPGGRDVVCERSIVRLEGNRVFLDAPITCALDQKYGGGKIYLYGRTGRVEHVGIEHLRADSDHGCDSLLCHDENHAWTFIALQQAVNCWVRDVTSLHFGFACVDIRPDSKWVTVADAESLDPVSRIAGGRRYAFHLDLAELCLFRNCRNRFDRHQFATSGPTPGPNVFVDGVSDESHDECGPHHRWATAALWDNIYLPTTGSFFGYGDAQLNIHNRHNGGHGWAGANCVAWNCYAVGGQEVESPPTAQNWSIGVFKPIPFGANPDPAARGNGSLDSTRKPVFPQSLYYAQMQDSLDAPFLQVREYVVGDFDRFSSPNNQGDVVPLDAGWREHFSVPIDGFDKLAGNHTVAWTHRFQLDPGDVIVSGTLSISLRATGSQPDNDFIYLGTTRSARLISDYADNVSSSGSTVIVIDLAGYLDALSSGQFNVAVYNDMAVDWSVLELRVAPKISAITNSLLPEADSFVQDGHYADENFGTAGTLAVKEDSDDGFDRRAFLRWDLSSIRGKVVHAKVRLTPVFVGELDIENAASVVTTTLWSETGVTWNNQPLAGHRFASWIVKDSIPVEFNVTTELQEALSNDRKLTLQLHSVRDVGDSGGVEYASRENVDVSSRPTLVVTIANSRPVVTVDTSGILVEPGSSTPPIPIHVSDLESVDLDIKAHSDVPTVVRPADIHLSGTGPDRTMTITPSLSYTGAVTITLVVSDGENLTSASFVVLFLPKSTPPNVHQPPSISHIQDLRIPENTSSGPIRFTIGGKPYGRVPPNPYQVTASCSNQTLLPPNNLIIGGSGTNGNITITPASNHFGSADVTVRVFDGQMTATETFRVDITAVQYPPSNVQLTHPLPDSVFTATDTIHLAANAADPDNDLTGVDFLVNGQIMGRDSGNPFTWNWSPPVPGVYRFMAAARDATGNSLTSAPIIAVVQPAANALVPLSAEWRYFNSNAPPANWGAPGFDDSSWPAGFAPIGFGNEQETPLTPDPAQITTFFRHSFVVSNAANFSQLSLRLYSEQGAVIYLNGTEVFRRFLPPGPITFDTLAVISASDGKDRSTVHTILPLAVLLSGTNTLAVELHRYGSADPILNFDLELAGYTAIALPRLEIERTENNVTLRWPDWSVGYDLEASSSLNASAAWKHLASTPAVLAGEQILTLPATNAVQLFRLHRP